MSPVLVIHDRPEQFDGLLEARFPDLRFVYATTPQAIAPALAAHDPQAVFSIGWSGFPGRTHRPVVEHPSVRWVQVGGSGYEHLLPWDTSRIQVTNAVGVLARFLAESVMAGILMLNGNFLAYVDQQRRGEWQPLGFRGLAGQTLVVVGLGAIGEWVARDARALGMHVIGIRRSSTPSDSVDELLPPECLREALARADVVSLHLRVDEQTRGLFDAAMLAAIRPGALFVNTGRGALVDEPALVESLVSGHLRGAYLDVFQTEPLPATSPLWAMPNVLITPHASDSVHDFPRRFAELFADNLERFMAGRPLLNPVAP